MRSKAPPPRRFRGLRLVERPQAPKRQPIDDAVDEGMRWYRAQREACQQAAKAGTLDEWLEAEWRSLWTDIVRTWGGDGEAQAT